MPQHRVVPEAAHHVENGLVVGGVELLLGLPRLKLLVPELLVSNLVVAQEDKVEIAALGVGLIQGDGLQL